MEYSEQALQACRESRLLINRCDEWLYDEMEPYLGQRILEVGCGLGNLLRHLLDRELVVGIDTSMGSIEALTSQYTERDNVQAFVRDITDPAVLDLARFGFDTVVSLNVLEHIENDELALSHMRELLVPGGRVVLIVPAHAFLYGTMDRAIGHYRRYTKASARQLFRRLGFRVEKQKYVNVLGALGWFVNGRILKQQVPPTNQLRLLNRIVPVLRFLENTLPPPVGISLLTVARRVDEGDN